MNNTTKSPTIPHNPTETLETLTIPLNTPLPDFTNLSSLKTLRIQDPNIPLTSIPFSQLPNLTTLHHGALTYSLIIINSLPYIIDPKPISLPFPLPNPPQIRKITPLFNQTHIPYYVAQTPPSTTLGYGYTPMDAYTLLTLKNTPIESNPLYTDLTINTPLSFPEFVYLSSLSLIHIDTLYNIYSQTIFYDLPQDSKIAQFIENKKILIQDPHTTPTVLKILQTLERMYQNYDTSHETEKLQIKHIYKTLYQHLINSYKNRDNQHTERSLSNFGFKRHNKSNPN